MSNPYNNLDKIMKGLKINRNQAIALVNFKVQNNKIPKIVPENLKYLFE